MAEVTTWQFLFGDDETVTCKQVKEYLEGETVSESGGSSFVETLTDFDKVLEILETRRFDLLILDLRLGPHDETREEEAGMRTLQAIQQRRFVRVARIYCRSRPEALPLHAIWGLWAGTNVVAWRARTGYAHRLCRMWWKHFSTTGQSARNTFGALRRANLMYEFGRNALCRRSLRSTGLRFQDAQSKTLVPVYEPKILFVVGQ